MKQKIVELLDLIFGFRKFIFLLVLSTIGIIFRLTGKIDGAQFVDLLKNTTIAFFAANGFEHISTTIQTYFNNKE